MRLYLTVLLLALLIGRQAHAASALSQDRLSDDERHYLGGKGEVIFVITHFPPYDFYNERNEHDGISVEFVHWMASEMGFKARFIELPLSEAKQAVLDGRADVILSLFYSRERDTVFDFTVPLFRIPAYIFVPTERTDIKSLRDLSGKRVAFNRGDYSHEFSRSRGIRCHEALLANFGDAVRYAAGGNADALIGDEPVIMYYLYAFGLEKKLKRAGEPLYIAADCMGVKNGEARLVSILNRGIERGRASGTLERISTKWLGKSYPPQDSFFSLYWQWMAGGLAFLLLLLGGVWYWNFELRRLVRQKTAELKRAYSEKLRMEEEIMRAQRLESLGVLAGGIAHDFNNILTAIMGNIALARMNTVISGPASGYLADSEKACMRAQKLTEQLLTFSRGGAPVKKPMEIEELVRENTLFSLSGSTVQARFNFAGGLWNVEADEGQLSQVVNNLVINALQAMPGGGVISVSAENCPFCAGNTGEPRGDYVRLRISDEGVGIARENLHRIFDPYFTTKEKGSGLGLASVFSIVKRHNGFIKVKSAPGEGSVFDVYLPATDAPAEKPDEDAVIRDHRGGGRILLMDDDEMVRRVLSKILQRLGYEVTAVFDGEEAIARYRKAFAAGERFNLVITDLTVPGGMGGKETIQRLVEIDPEVTALVTSGYSNDAVLADFRAYGFRGVIRKPFRIEEVSAALGDILSGRADT